MKGFRMRKIERKRMKEEKGMKGKKVESLSRRCCLL